MRPMETGRGAAPKPRGIGAIVSHALAPVAVGIQKTTGARPVPSNPVIASHGLTRAPAFTGAKPVAPPKYLQHVAVHAGHWVVDQHGHWVPIYATGAGKWTQGFKPGTVAPAKPTTTPPKQALTRAPAFATAPRTAPIKIGKTTFNIPALTPAPAFASVPHFSTALAKSQGVAASNRALTALLPKPEHHGGGLHLGFVTIPSPAGVVKAAEGLNWGRAGHVLSHLGSDVVNLPQDTTHGLWELGKTALIHPTHLPGLLNQMQKNDALAQLVQGHFKKASALAYQHPLGAATDVAAGAGAVGRLAGAGRAAVGAEALAPTSREALSLIPKGVSHRTAHALSGLAPVDRRFSGNLLTAKAQRALDTRGGLPDLGKLVKHPKVPTARFDREMFKRANEHQATVAALKETYQASERAKKGHQTLPLHQRLAIARYRAKMDAGHMTTHQNALINQATGDRYFAPGGKTSAMKELEAAGTPFVRVRMSSSPHEQDIGRGTAVPHNPASGPNYSLPEIPVHSYKTSAAEINSKTWYHGTNVKDLSAEGLAGAGTNEANLFGQGIYLTDNPEIAKSYGEARSRRTGEPTVYGAHLQVRNPLDLEAPVDPKFTAALVDRMRHLAGIGDKEAAARLELIAHKPGTTNAALYREFVESVADFSQAEEIPRSELVEDFQVLAGDLRNRGFDALTHVGGTRAGKGKVLHQAIVLLDPEGTGQAGLHRQVKEFSPLDTMHKPIAPAKQQPVESSEPPRDVILPKVLVDTLKKHTDNQARAENSGIGGDVIAAVQNRFRRTVLPFSAKWIAGNTAEAGIRSALYGIGPQNVGLGHALIKAMRDEGLHPEAGRLQAQALQGTHFSMQARHAREFFREHPNATVAHYGKAAGKVTHALGKPADISFKGNSALEQQFAHTALGKYAVKDLRDIRRDNPGISEADAMRKLAHLYAKPEKAAGAGRYIRQVYGKYAAFGPTMNRFVHSAAPFSPWYGNALKFMGTLPFRHPIATTALLSAARATDPQWVAEHKKVYGLGPEIGSFPMTGPQQALDIARYMPTGAFTGGAGAKDPLSAAIADFLPVLGPQVSSAALAAYGLDPFGRQLLYPGPAHKRLASGKLSQSHEHQGRTGLSDHAGNAISALLGGMAGFYPQARRVLGERGGTPYTGTDLLWNPSPPTKQAKPPLNLAGIVAGLNKVFNPVKPINLTPTRPKRGSHRGRSGGSPEFGGGSRGTEFR